MLRTPTGNIEGTLLVPANRMTDGCPVSLIISGSGPTDRDGNNPMMNNNSLKMLAEGLAEKGIASLRYDKRAIGRSREAGADESALRLDDYIADAAGWIEMLEGDARFTSIAVIGHSLGSLVGMIAAREAGADRFVSIAGSGEPGADAIRRQLGSQPPIVMKYAAPILDSLEQGFLVHKIDPALNSLFRASVQPYLLSWFRFDPVEEISQLKKPILIVQGTTDLQITAEDARMLHEAAPSGELVILEGMNHVLKEAGGDRNKNLAAYYKPDLPLFPGLVSRIAEFILQDQ